jgi:alpha-D-ribose 1-methylphosphonate 5-phosphate C-P lyase
MPNEFKQVGNQRIQLTDEEQAAMDVLRVAQQAAQDAEEAKETVRMSKRPKRSQINATMSSVAGATTVPELRVAVANLMTLMDNVLVFQQVDVDEDE